MRILAEKSCAFVNFATLDQAIQVLFLFLFLFLFFYFVLFCFVFVFWFPSFTNPFPSLFSFPPLPSKKKARSGLQGALLGGKNLRINYGRDSGSNNSSSKDPGMLLSQILEPHKENKDTYFYTYT